MTANQAIQTDSYPLPHADELFANLSGGKYFYKLDMSNAHLQLPLDEASQKVVAIHTHKGLFKYTHVQSSASQCLIGTFNFPALYRNCLTWSNRSLSVSQ